jgi:hypothetical protein
MSRLLGGAYDGETDAEKYFTDKICDIVIDCTFSLCRLTGIRMVRCAWPEYGADNMQGALSS